LRACGSLCRCCFSGGFPSDLLGRAFRLHLERRFLCLGRRSRRSGEIGALRMEEIHDLRNPGRFHPFQMRMIVDAVVFLDASFACPSTQGLHFHRPVLLLVTCFECKKRHAQTLSGKANRFHQAKNASGKNWGTGLGHAPGGLEPQLPGHPLHSHRRPDKGVRQRGQATFCDISNVHFRLKDESSSISSTASPAQLSRCLGIFSLISFNFCPSSSPQIPHPQGATHEWNPDDYRGSSHGRSLQHIQSEGSGHVSTLCVNIPLVNINITKRCLTPFSDPFLGRRPEAPPPPSENHLKSS